MGTRYFVPQNAYDYCFCQEEKDEEVLEVAIFGRDSLE